MVLKSSLENSTALFSLLTPHKWGNRYNCLFFSPKDIEYRAQGESTRTRSREAKAAVSTAKRAWHRQVLPLAVPWNVLFCAGFLCVEKKANNTMIPRNMSKPLTPFCIPHTCKGMPKLICDWLIPRSGLSHSLFKHGQSNLFKLNFEELIVGVLSPRWDPTAHCQDWQGFSKWVASLQSSVDRDAVILTAPWSHESQTWFGNHAAQTKAGEEGHVHSQLSKSRQLLSHWLGIHWMWLWSETLTALWKHPSFFHDGWYQ